MPAVLARKEPQVAVSLAASEHEVVCLPYLLQGGSEWDKGIGQALEREFPDNAIEVAWVGVDGGHLECLGIDLVILGHCCGFLGFK